MSRFEHIKDGEEQSPSSNMKNESIISSFKLAKYAQLARPPCGSGMSSTPRVSQYSPGNTKSQKHFVIHRVQCMKRRHPMIIIRVDLIKRSFCSPVILCPLSCRFRMAVTVAPTEPGVAFSTLQALKILILKGSLSVRAPGSVFRCFGGRHLGVEFRHPSRVNWRADELQ